MATEEGVPTAHQVSEAFVEQYYRIVGGELSHEAHRLYVDASVVSRPGPDGTMVSFTSIEAINKHFISCECTTFEVLSVDSQSSLENGIFIMVIGFLTGEDNLKRKFSQMFYLARQNATYVVVNDMFRYVDEEASTPETLPAVESVPETEVAKPVDEINKAEPIRKIDAPAEQVKNVSDVKKAVTGATPPLDNGNTKHSVEKAVTAQKLKEPVAETAAPPLDGAKKSYAAMVESLRRNAAPFQVKAAPVQKPKYMEQPKARAAAAPKAHTAVSKFDKKNDQRIVDEPGTSMFVANLPMDAMPHQLHELFKGFGPFKENGVQVRSSSARGTCFGFVSFESATSVQSVLKVAKNNPFRLGDRKLRVKEKEVDYDGNKPSGGRSVGGSKTPNGSVDGSKPFGGRSGGGSKTPNGSVEGSKTDNVSADGSKTENGSADAEDGFQPIISRRNRRKGNLNLRQ